MAFMYQEQLMNADDFLTWAADQEALHELIAGQPHALADRDPAFFRVLVNVTLAIQRHLGDGEWATFVRGEALTVDVHHVLFPDAMVANRRHPADPTVVVEVLSTAARSAYAVQRSLVLQRIRTLMEHVVVDLPARRLRVHRRQASGGWVSTLYRIGETAVFESLGMQFSVADAFAGMAGGQRHLTLDEFLAWDNAPGRGDHQRHEFFDGVIAAASGAFFGAKKNHERVVVNLVFALRGHLADTGCEVFGSNLRLLCDDAGAAFFPDVSVVCDAEDERTGDEMRRPMILIEVLSKSTESRDRTVKRRHYLQIPTLKEYVLIDYLQRRIDIHHRQQDGSWRLRQCIADAPLTLDSIGLVMPAEEVYRRVRGED